MFNYLIKERSLIKQFRLCLNVQPDSIWTSICFPQGQVALHSHLLNGQAIKHVVCQLSQGQTEIQGFS